MIKTIQGKDLALHDDGLRALEASIIYPFGEDSFRLDHGLRYPAFFERLGEPVFNLAVESGEVVAAAAGILRAIPFKGSLVRAWYLCDLKVRADHRGKKLTARLFRQNLLRHYLRCPRGYAISMNPALGENKVVEILRNLPYVPISFCCRLDIWSFDFSVMNELEAELRELVGPISYLSLAGIKDLRMSSHGGIIPLVHVQHGPLAQHGDQAPSPGYTHMICAPEGSDLHRRLLRTSPPSASASVVAHRMKDVDWGFILTSEI